MTNDQDSAALLIPTGEAASAPITDDDKTALLIPEPRPQGAMSLAEVSEYLNVSPETVTSGLNHSLTHYEGSDRVRWYEPGSVEQTRARIAHLRRAADLNREQERQKVRQSWSETLRRR